MADSGWTIDLVVPHGWKHEYAAGLVPPAKLPEFQGSFRPRRIALPGKQQRHFYLRGGGALVDEIKPDIAFLEEESFSLAALQWGAICWRHGVPFGIQADENLDRDLPLPSRLWRRWTLGHAAFVAARSPTAMTLVKQWGARGEVEVIPHAVPSWPTPPREQARDGFTIGFAGRLVPEKGLDDLVAAARRLSGTPRLLFVGNGPMRDELAAAGNGDVKIEITSDIKHDDMASAFAGMDVLVLPSRTTPTWAEQFGRVLVEALWCGVPVIGSSSGEIPWVIGATGGGLVFPEGDVSALTAALDELRSNPEERTRLADRGRGAVERLFSTDATAAALGAILERTMNR